MTSYFQDLAKLYDDIVTDVTGVTMSLETGIDMAVTMITGTRKTILVGNGGSAAIASHIATDAIKNAGLRALTFSDPSLLTCLSNDRGYPEVYATPVAMFGEAGDVLIAISSSGNSENIIRAVEEGLTRDMTVITLSGFDKGNRLRRMGSLSFYVPAHAYGMVEIAHLSILHAIMDAIIVRQCVQPR